jgi:hypothetical protein
LQLTTHRVFEPSDGSKHTIIDPDFPVALEDVNMTSAMIRSGKKQDVYPLILRLTRLEWFKDGRGLTQDDTPLQSRHAAALGQSCMVRGGQLTRKKLKRGNWNAEIGLNGEGRE